MLLQNLTNQIICAFYKVYNSLGHGFLEKVYANSMAIELRKSKLEAVQEQKVTVFYQGEPVGIYIADIVVNDLVILELKAVGFLRNEHLAQVTNYLKATDKEVGLLLNFGHKPEIKRVVLGNHLKRNLPKDRPCS